MQMFNAHIYNMKKERREFAETPILRFFERNQTALWHAARFLGGYESARLVDRCSQTLERERTITNHTQIMLNQIVALLSLRNAQGLDQPYMGFYVAIDPHDPVVDEICLLVDGLRHAIKDAESRREWAEAQTRMA